jgi:hypothetical protein
MTLCSVLPAGLRNRGTTKDVIIAGPLNGGPLQFAATPFSS